MEILLNLAYGLVCFGLGLLCGSVVEKFKAVRRNTRKSPLLVMKPTENTVQYILGGKFKARNN